MQILYPIPIPIQFQFQFLTPQPSNTNTIQSIHPSIQLHYPAILLFGITERERKPPSQPNAM